jgi:hypothetical protein
MEGIMATHFGKIDNYFTNILAPKGYAGKRLMNLTGSFGKAIVWFIPNGSPLPDNKKHPGENVFDVYYQIDDWEAIIDIMRNEKPVYFNFNDACNTAQIYTGNEPVGEEEHAS